MMDMSKRTHAPSGVARLPKKIVHITEFPMPLFTSSDKTDSVLAAALIASPAWANWLGELNTVLTSITLLCGALLGLGRLCLFFRRWKQHQQD